MQQKIILGLLGIIGVVLLATVYIYAGMYMAQTGDGPAVDDTESVSVSSDTDSMSETEVLDMQNRLDASTTTPLTEADVASMEAGLVEDSAFMSEAEVAKLFELLAQ